MDHTQTDTKTKNMRIVTITDAAAQEIARLIQDEENQGKSVRLAVRGGGCSGLSYVVDFGEAKDNDYVDEQHGFTVLVDPKSGLYLKDVVLDFNTGLNGRGFKWVNPHATNTCGCGESFSI
jgi:iron-sulfur cluster assembly protein